MSLSDGWQGSAQWYTQVHLVCTALEWAARGVVEDPGRPNRGAIVDTIHLRYRGWDAATLEREWARTKTGVGLAWCAEFVWCVVDDVCRKLGIANCLPGWSTALGRARDTLEKSRGKLPVVTWQDLDAKTGVTIQRASGNVVVGRNGRPEVGWIFYRTSQPARQSSDSTGHMGIVVAVASDGSFDTIEGNQGTSDRVARYHYTAADLARYSFQFILVSECAAVTDNPTGVLSPTKECFTQATGTTRIQGTVGTVVDIGPTTTTTSLTVAGAGGSGTSGSGNGGSDCSVASVLGRPLSALSESQKVTACTDVRLMDLPAGLLLHHGELRRKDAAGRRVVAADILGATYGIGAATDAFFGIRNGSAVNRAHPARNGRDQHSGVGIFRMKSGRLVYVLAEESLQWHNLWQNNLFGAGYGDGQPPWRIHIERTQGDGFAEYMSEVLAGDAPLNGPAGSAPRLGWAAQGTRPVVLKGAAGGGVISNLLGTEIPYRTLQDILDAIERAGTAGESRDLAPLVVSYNMQPIPWTKSLGQIIQVATLALSVAMPVAGTIVSASTLKTLQAVKDNLDRLMKVVGGLQGGDSVTLALDLGAAFLPTEYAQYVAPATSAYRAAVGKNPGEALRALQLLAKTDLGTEALRWGEQLISGVAIDVGAIAKAAAKPFDAVRRQIATYQVGQMVGTVAQLTAGDVDFAKKLLRVTGQKISEVPYLSTAVTALAGGNHPSTVPNLGGIARMIAMTGELQNVLQGRAEGARSDVFATLSLLAQGFAAPCATFRDLAYQSFRQQAEKLRGAGTTTIAAPVLVGPEDSECFSYRVRQDVPGLTVLYGEPKTTTSITTSGVTTSGGTTSGTTYTVPGGTVSGGTVRGDTVRGGFGRGTTDISVSPPATRNDTSTTITRLGLIGTEVAPGRNDVGSGRDAGSGTTIEPRSDWNTVTPGVVECPPGYVRVGNECYPPTPTVHDVECPPGYVRVGNECYPPTPTVHDVECPPGYVHVGTECVAPPPPIRESPCPPGYTRNGNECVAPPPPVRESPCPPGYTRNGNECVAPPPPVRESPCPPGYTRNGNECVPPSPTVVEPTCPPGYRLQRNGNGEYECVPPVTVRTDWTPQAPTPPVPPMYAPCGATPGGAMPGGSGWPPFIFTMPLAPARDDSGCGCD